MLFIIYSWGYVFQKHNAFKHIQYDMECAWSY